MKTTDYIVSRRKSNLKVDDDYGYGSSSGDSMNI